MTTQHTTDNFIPKKKKILVKTLMSVLGIFCIFFLGIYIGYTKQSVARSIDTVLNIKSENSPTDIADFEEFWKVWKLLDEKYPQAKEHSNKERLWGSIHGLVASMRDPYTVYFPPTESKIFNDEVSGSFSGIGVEIGVKEGSLVVIAPLKNSPAEKAGIKAGDIITKVDGFAVALMSVDESIQHIRGEKGTSVIMTILRKDAPEPIDLTVIRDTINIPTIDEENLGGDIYLIRLYNFNASAADLFHKALINAKQQQKKNIIIDLRGNPGGYLEGAVSIASEILPEGQTIVSEDYGSDKKTLVHRSYGYKTLGDDIKIIILIDKGSASASEIVAGALQDTKRATLIGETSFGKGSVQELLAVSKDTSIKITVAHWLTPNGSSISEKGITPDISISQKNPSKNAYEDETIKKTIEFIRTGKK